MHWKRTLFFNKYDFSEKIVDDYILLNLAKRRKKEPVFNSYLLDCIIIWKTLKFFNLPCIIQKIRLEFSE